MDRYDIENQKFIRKSNILGAEFETQKLPSGPYELKKFSLDTEIVQILPFISRVAHNALVGCRHMKKLILPNSLRSVHIRLNAPLKEINIPEKVVGIHRISNVVPLDSLKITLEGCNKSVQGRAFHNMKDVDIINSQLISRVNKLGFAFSSIHELRLINAEIDGRGLWDCKIGKLFLSAYSSLEGNSFTKCKIDTLYYFVESEAAKNKLLYDLANSIIKIRGFSECEIGRIVPIVEPNIYEIIHSQRD